MLDNCFGRPGSMPNPAGGPLLAWTTAGIAFPDVDLVHGPFAPDPGWFRGYQYARYLRRITGISLLEPVIEPALVAVMAQAIADAWNHYPRGADLEQVITQPNDRFIRLETHLPDNAMPSQQVLDSLAILSCQIAHNLLLADTLPTGSGSRVALRIQGMSVEMVFVPCDLVLSELGELAKLFAFAARTGLHLYAWE